MIARWLRSVSAPEIFLVLVLLVFGSIACLGIPLSAGYDEETHLVRAWEMAHLYFVPNDQLSGKLPFPAIYWELSYRRQPLVEAVAPGFWSKYGSLRIDAHDYIYDNVTTRSVYSPLLLLPQAFVLRYLGLSMQLPALTVYYACRFAGLLSYLILCWLAVRSIPFGKWLLAVLMVSPMALFQASSISADTISNGIGFLFLGGSLGIAARDEISWKQWLLLAGLSALLFTAKVNLLFLVLIPFLLIRPSQFKMKHGYALLVAATAALLLVEVAGWNVLAYAHVTRMLAGASPAGQVRYILSAPLQFARIIALDLWTNSPAYWQGWIGVYGYNYWPVPGLTYILYPLAVIAALLVSSWETGMGGTLDPGARLIGQRVTQAVLAGLFVVGVLLTIVSLYLAFTPVGTQGVAGVQGRYFTPIMPLLLLALVGLPGARGIIQRVFRGRSAGPALGWTLGFALAALVLYTGGMLLSYHVPCGSQYYEPGLCYQPVYKNWAPTAASSPAVSPSMTLTQEIVPQCSGMQELDVWVNSAGKDPAATTEVTLHSTEQQRDVLRQTIRDGDISAPGWLRLSFAPEPASQGSLYLLTIKGSAPGGVQAGYSLKADYTAGKLYENGAAMSQDLLFQYGCAAGLQKALESLNVGASGH